MQIICLIIKLWCLIVEALVFPAVRSFQLQFMHWSWVWKIVSNHCWVNRSGLWLAPAWETLLVVNATVMQTRTYQITSINNGGSENKRFFLKDSRVTRRVHSWASSNFSLYSSHKIQSNHRVYLSNLLLQIFKWFMQISSCSAKEKCSEQNNSYLASFLERFPAAGKVLEVFLFEK